MAMICFHWMVQANSHQRRCIANAVVKNTIRMAMSNSIITCFMGDPSSRPPHIGSGWLIASSWADKIIRSWLLLSVGALLIEKGRMFFGLKREFK
jgi:hypothetical protein